MTNVPSCLRKACSAAAGPITTLALLDKPSMLGSAVLNTRLPMMSVPLTGQATAAAARTERRELEDVSERWSLNQTISEDVPFHGEERRLGSAAAQSGRSCS